MKVIIVEVTRAANSFGRTHLPEIRRAYDLIAKIVADGQEAGAFRGDIDPMFASMCFYGAIEQLLSGWIFDVIPAADDRLRASQGPGRDDDLRRPRASIGKVGSRVWRTRSSEDCSGAGCSPPAAPSPASSQRARGLLWRRVFDEDPPE